jgi:hypothetical protein
VRETLGCGARRHVVVSLFRLSNSSLLAKNSQLSSTLESSTRFSVHQLPSSDEKFQLSAQTCIESNRITKQSARRATRNHRGGRHIKRNISGHHHQLTNLSRRRHTRQMGSTQSSRKTGSNSIFSTVSKIIFLSVQKSSSSSVALSTSDVCVITSSAFALLSRRGDFLASLPSQPAFIYCFGKRGPSTA